MVEVYLMLGSNIGDRLGHIHQTSRLISYHVGKIDKVSSIYETSPWGMLEQDSFCNQAIRIYTALSAHGLMTELQRIERYVGKENKEKYGPRIIDIDILFYGDAVIEMPELTIPHPRMTERNFVLVPLAEIAATKLHPTKNISIDELKRMCIDKGTVSLLTDL